MISFGLTCLLDDILVNTRTSSDLLNIEIMNQSTLGTKDVNLSTRFFFTMKISKIITNKVLVTFIFYG